MCASLLFCLFFVLEWAYLSVTFDLCEPAVWWGGWVWGGGWIQCFFSSFPVLLELLSWCWWWVDMLLSVQWFHFYHIDNNKPCALLWPKCSPSLFSGEIHYTGALGGRTKLNSPRLWSTLFTALFIKRCRAAERRLQLPTALGFWEKKREKSLSELLECRTRWTSSHVILKWRAVTSTDSLDVRFFGFRAQSSALVPS